MISNKAGFDAESDEKGRAHATISELYPDVGRIILFVAFEEADSESEPNHQHIIFTAQTKAVFRLDCSRDECVGGGFDFSPVVAEMVKNKKSRVQGKLACEGTLGAGGHRCSLKAEYRIVLD
jgi:hypothetical protein